MQERSGEQLFLPRPSPQREGFYAVIPQGEARFHKVDPNAAPQEKQVDDMYANLPVALTPSQNRTLKQFGGILERHYHYKRMLDELDSGTVINRAIAVFPDGHGNTFKGSR